VKNQRPHHEIHQVLGHQVRRVLGAAEAGLDHREAGLHEHDQRPGDQDPDELRRRRVLGVERGDLIGDRSRLFGKDDAAGGEDQGDRRHQGR
jgi:hypothetical protein